MTEWPTSIKITQPPQRLILSYQSRPQKSSRIPHPASHKPIQSKYFPHSSPRGPHQLNFATNYTLVLRPVSITINNARSPSVLLNIKPPPPAAYKKKLSSTNYTRFPRKLIKKAPFGKYNYTAVYGNHKSDRTPERGRAGIHPMAKKNHK